MITSSQITKLCEWLIARGEGDGVDILSKERADIRLLTALPAALASFSRGEDAGAWGPGFEAISLRKADAKMTKGEQADVIQQLVIPAISGTWNRTPDFAQTNVCPRVIELMLKLAPPLKTVIDLEIGTGELLVEALKAGAGNVVKVKGYSEPIYRQTKLQPADSERAEELAELARVRCGLLVGSKSIEIHPKAATFYHYPKLGYDEDLPDVPPVSAYCIPWQSLDGEKTRVFECLSEAQRLIGTSDSANSDTLVLLLPYSLVYGRDFNRNQLEPLFRHRRLSCVIQLPAGSRGAPIDQPLLFLYRTIAHGYEDLPVLFIDATRAPRASEHGRALSADGLGMIISAFKCRESVGQVFAQVHQVGSNFFNQGLPPMGRLVQPPVEAEKTLESMREESERLTKEVNKLRDELKDLFDR